MQLRDNLYEMVMTGVGSSSTYELSFGSTTTRLRRVSQTFTTFSTWLSPSSCIILSRSAYHSSSSASVILLTTNLTPATSTSTLRLKRLDGCVAFFSS
ncbi:MAG: hypothetical protein RMH74_00095, partial [Candidatus Caldarchaeum sp.]|nr:hypothetical protein [Candidatus Caldarchaeum sp.]